MKRFLTRWFSLSDIPNYLSLLVGTIVGILSILGFLFSPSDGVIMFLLGALAGSMFVESKIQSGFRTKVFALAEDRKDISDFLINFGDLPPFEKRVRDAGEIWISGPTLSGFLLRYERLLSDLLSNSVKVRCLIGPIDNELEKPMKILLGGATEEERERYRYSVNLSLNILKKLSKKYTNLETRFFGIIPTHNLIIINPNGLDGEVQVHLIVYNQDSDRCPLMIIRSLDALESFALFKNEFDDIWRTSANINH